VRKQIKFVNLIYKKNPINFVKGPKLIVCNYIIRFNLFSL